MKNIAITGSTGLIGTQTLDVARKNEDLRVVAVSAGKKWKTEEQIAVRFVISQADAWMKKTWDLCLTTFVIAGMGHRKDFGR